MNKQSGFTLIELSIVLVIIGLIIGGVLVGRDLVRAAGVRSTISQIEKYNAAVNTFRGKYGYLPGDIAANAAAQFGFSARGTGIGMGDGNGVIESTAFTEIAPCGDVYAFGETIMFWVDLTTANGKNVNLIEGGFSLANSVNFSNTDVTGVGIDLYFPPAKLGQGNYIYVWSGGPQTNSGIDPCGKRDSLNYFGLSQVSKIENSDQGEIDTAPGLTVRQAYDMDKKIDDGLPQSGRVTAQYVSASSSVGPEVVWAGVGSLGTQGAATTTSTAGSAATCYDNGSSNAAQQYSLSQNNGNGVNCALSFRFQ